MSTGDSSMDLDATLREFVSGQKLFNRYTLTKTLGRGGMGVVWLARDDELERNVALKFLPEMVIHDRAVLGDLKRETRRSLELTHKNIVRIYDFVHNESSGCISMEYIDGDTLSNLRADKRDKVFDTAELADWTSQMCDALDYAHNHARIIHRDLKPANLMVNQRGDLKVSDFGIARSLSDSVSKLTMQRGKSGTLVYMSPQQLDGERGDHLDDVYSIGATLYELLTSKPPFFSGNVDRQIREKTPPTMTQRRRELEINGRVDPTWEQVVRDCLAKEPSKRPQSVIEIARRLDVTSPKTRHTQQEPLKKSKRTAIFVVIALLLGAAAACGWYFGYFENLDKWRKVVTAPRPEPKTSTTTLAPIETPAPSIATPMPSAAATPVPSPSVPEPPPVPMGPRIVANAIYEGTIHVKNESSTNVPLTITIGSDLKSGTMTQSGRRGDVVVKFAGVWDGATLRAVTDQVVSAPKGLNWEPESFSLHFTDDGKSAAYECLAGGKMYIADLSAQSAPVVKAAPIYKGVIRARDGTGPGTPLTINLAADRKSGTMTQSSKSGDTVVRFSGIWDGDRLRAVTNDVISKPKNIQWKPESFTLRFTDEGKRGLYECNSEGRIYSAELSPP